MQSPRSNERPQDYSHPLFCLCGLAQTIRVSPRDLVAALWLMLMLAMLAWLLWNLEIDDQQ